MKKNPIARRKFIKYSAASITGTILVKNAFSLPQPFPKAELSITSEVDLLVVGAGTAGTIAAIQAGRAGAKTLLVERSHQLGGTTTKGGVAFPGLFDAWGKQVIAGIGWELVRESVELDGGTLPDFRKIPKNHWENQVLLNQFIYSLLAEEKCADAGVEIAYYEFPHTIVKTDDGWQVDVVGPGTRRRVFCKQIIDCTGGADIVGMLGLTRMRDEETQPGSMLFNLEECHKPGRKRNQDIYVHGADSSNSVTITKANLAGRHNILNLVRKHKKRLTHLQPETAFRESYRILGEYVIDVDDYTLGYVFKDALCYAFYPVDLHTRDGVKPKPLGFGHVPTIPRRALIPKDSEDIMVAGRSVSSDRLANSGLRVQASCMAMGQAAGVTAVLAAQKNTTPLDVPITEIRAMLKRHGAILPEA